MRTPVLLLAASLTLGSFAQTLFEEDFEGTPAFTLNTNDANSISGVANTWVVNDTYAGGSGVADCLGIPLDFSIAATASQPVDISGPNGNYLHTASLVALGNNIFNCSFGAADGFCTNADDVFARMSTDVSTIGSADVTLNFWWLCNGGNQNYGELYYSVNGGGSWQQITVPIAQYRNTTTWGEQTVTLPAFGEQATLRFGFRFHNGESLFGGSDPGFAIDDVRITASNIQPVSISAGVSPLGYCQGSSMSVSCGITGTFNAGNVFSAELSDNSGSFAAPVIIGTLVSTNGGTIGCTVPPGTPQGTGYRVRVASSAPAATSGDNGQDITIYDAPFAGSNASFSICSGDAPVGLSTGGDPGGSWTGPSLVSGGLYDPGSMEPGTYIYTVSGTGPCASDSATVEVAEIPGANAGISAEAVICKNTGIYELFEYVGGSPQTGGTWTGPGGSPSDGTFNSATANGGIYTYTVDPGGRCGTDEAVVNVQVGLPGEAGEDGTWTVCSTSMPVDLYDLLAVEADADGFWYSNGLPFNGEAEEAGAYVYIAFADPPCANDTASITLEVPTAPFAGENSTIEVCASAPPVDLINALGGEPQSGGAWTAPDGSAHSGTFVPGTDAFGLYTYSITGIEPCTDDEAVVAVVPCVGMNESGPVLSLVWLGQNGGGEHLFSLPAMRQATVDVLDAVGRVIRQEFEVATTGRLSVDLGVSSPGTYTLRIRSEGRIGTVRFVH